MHGEGLELRGLRKSFGEAVVLDGIDLDVRPGEIVAITGPSGAGKTTVCRLISGLEAPDAGEILLGGENFSALPPQKRRAAYMFESYALYPHLTVARNIAFPFASRVARRRMDHGSVEARVSELLRLTQIEHLRERRPGELSGGQKQRVALCRALIQDGSVFLLDEPISHLDAKLRNELRGAIRRRQTAAAVPTLWSTPDAMEALSIADRVAVLIDGKLQQFGTPEDIYFRPASTSVARLVGDPAMNLLAGEIRSNGSGVAFASPDVEVPLSSQVAERLAALPAAGVTLGVRPTALDIRSADGDETAVAMRVYAWEPFGKFSIVTGRLGDTLVRIKTKRTEKFPIDDKVNVVIDTDSIILFDGLGCIVE